MPAHSQPNTDISFLPKPTELKELYRRSLEQMRRLEPEEAQARKRALVIGRAFGPFLPMNPRLDAPPSRQDSDELRALKDEWVAKKYRQLLEQYRQLLEPYRQLLKDLGAAKRRTFDQVCQVLAMWLKDEAICNPDDLLPKNVLWRLTKTTRQLFGNFRPAEKTYADMVVAVLPYFRMAVKTYQHLHHRGANEIRQDLKNLGFDPDAIRAVDGLQHQPRSALAAACRFVAFRYEIDEDTIHTAFSRIYPQKPKVRRKPIHRRKKAPTV